MRCTRNGRSCDRRRHGWLLLATVVLTVAVSAAATASASNARPVGCPVDTAKLSLTGIELGQAVVAILAVLAISGEYSTGMIRTTLTAMPRRTTVLAAKAAIVSGLVLAAGTVAVLGSVLAGRLILPGQRLHRRPRLPAAVAGRRPGAARRRRLGPLPGPDRPAQPGRRHRGAGLRARPSGSCSACSTCSRSSPRWSATRTGSGTSSRSGR